MYLLCKLPGDLDEAAACVRSVLNLPASNGASKEHQKRYGLNIGGGYYYSFALLGLDLCLCKNEGEVVVDETPGWPYYLWIHSDGDFTDVLRHMGEALEKVGVATKFGANA